MQQLERRELDRQREELALHEERERQQRRQARGYWCGKEANQANILLGRQKERSESSASRSRQQRTGVLEQLTERIREAAHEVENEAAISLHFAAGHAAGAAARGGTLMLWSYRSYRKPRAGSA
ncbi:hypothetical protein M1D55_11275 [Cupriavidus sp. JZ107]